MVAERRFKVLPLIKLETLLIWHRIVLPHTLIMSLTLNGLLKLDNTQVFSLHLLVLELIILVKIFVTPEFLF